MIVATVGVNEGNPNSNKNFIPAMAGLVVELQVGDRLTVRQNSNRPEAAHNLAFCVHLVHQIPPPALTHPPRLPSSLSLEKPSLASTPLRSPAPAFTAGPVAHPAPAPTIPAPSLPSPRSSGADSVIKAGRGPGAHGYHEARTGIFDLNTDYTE